MIAHQQLASVSILDTCIGLRHISFKASVEHFCREFAEELGLAGMGAVLHRQRVIAAQRAADHCRGEAPDLDQVYEEIQLLPEWPTTPDAMKAAEIRFHIDQAVCSERAHELLETIRRHGSSIAFLASTPLPASAVRELLLRFGLFGEHDEVCLSHELGREFNSREGFRRFLQGRPSPAKRWTHYGSGDRAERRAVEAVGGTYHSLFDPTPNRYEISDPKDELEDPIPASAIAAVQRNTRMLTGEQQEPVLNRIFANVVAPLLTSYVQEVLHDAQARGLDTLYFVARDGQILKLIAEELPHDGISLRYLYGSRQAWLLPSVANRPEEAHTWMTLWGQPTSPRSILKRAEITPEEVQPWLNSYNLAGKEDAELRGNDVSAMNALLREPSVLDLIAKKARFRRETMVAYLEQEGLMDAGRWALVDIGWACRCQRAVNTALRDSGFTGTVCGYYLGLNQHHEDLSETGPAFAYAVDDLNLPRDHPVRILFRYQALLEEVFTVADHGPTRYYEWNGEHVQPVLGEYLPQPVKRQVLLAQQLVCRHFARLCAESEIVRQHNAALKRQALRNVATFFNEPEIEEVQAIRWLKVGSDQNESGKLPIAKPYSFFDCVRIFKRRVLQYQAHSHSRWREGSIAISSSIIRAAITTTVKVYAFVGEQRARKSRTLALT